MTPRNLNSPAIYDVSITKAAKIDKIVEYTFEKSERLNVLAIHPTRPLIAYLINIQRAQKISKAWLPENDSTNSPSSSCVNGQNNSDKNKTVSIRIIDYSTRQRCLAKGVYLARPTECAFAIHSPLGEKPDIHRLAVVDRLANVYLYDITYFSNEITATRLTVLRGPGQDPAPCDNINLVWCPFVPCEDFEDGDGGQRLALSTDSRVEIFAIDRIKGKLGELKRSELAGSYKCIQEAHKSNIVSLSISPDCSTLSAAALDNRVTFFSSDIDDMGQRCLHTWEAPVSDKSSISKLFFLDDYPKLLENSSMKFWGSAFIGARNGQMMLVDLRSWSVYQKANLTFDLACAKNFDYRIDLTSHNIVAMNGSQCYVVQIEHPTDKNQSSSSDPSETLPKIVSVTNLSRADYHNNPIYSFVIKHKSEKELELFTITAGSLERYTINLKSLKSEVVSSATETPITANELKRFLQKFDGTVKISSPSGTNDTLNNTDTSLLNSGLRTPVKQAMDVISLMSASASYQSSPLAAATPSLKATPKAPAPSLASNNSMLNNNMMASQELSLTSALDTVKMDRMFEALFSKLNTTFSQGLNEFFTDIRSEFNDLKMKLDGLSREVKKLQHQVQDARQK